MLPILPPIGLEETSELCHDTSKTLKACGKTSEVFWAQRSGHISTHPSHRAQQASELTVPLQNVLSWTSQCLGGYIMVSRRTDNGVFVLWFAEFLGLDSIQYALELLARHETRYEGGDLIAANFCMRICFLVYLFQCILSICPATLLFKKLTKH